MPAKLREAAQSGPPGGARRDERDNKTRASKPKRQRTPKRLTSIGELFELELNLLKLCAGFMLDERFNWYFSVAYKLAIVAISRYLVATTFIVYNRLGHESKSLQQNTRFFWTLYAIASFCSLINCFFSSIRHKKLLSILLRKSLDARYFEGPLVRWPRASEQPLEFASSPPASANLNETAQDSPAAGARRAESRKLWRNFRPARNNLGSHLVGQASRVRENVVQLGSDFRRGASLVRSIPKVKLARYLFYLNILLAGLAATVRVQFERANNESPQAVVSRRLAQTATTSGRSVQSGAAANQRFNGTSRVATGAIATGSRWDSIGPRNQTGGNFGAISSLKRQERLRKLWESFEMVAKWSLQAALKVARSIPSFLFYTALATLNSVHLYGQIIIAFFITSALCDLLRRASEQESRQAQDYRAQLLEGGVSGPQSGSPTLLKAAEDARQQRRHRAAALRTTELLIQVRDALIALRSASSLDYLFIQVSDMARQMGLFSLFTSFVASGRYEWLGIISFDYARLALSDMMARLGYHWLHTEVRKFCCISEQRLVQSSLEAYDLRMAGEEGGPERRMFLVGGGGGGGSSPSACSSSSAGLPRHKTNSSSSAATTTTSSSGIALSSHRQSPSSSSSLSSSSSSSLTSTSYTNMSGNANSAQAAHQRRLELEARRLQLDRVTHVEATINFRLAKEIEQLWPTDWFKPDLQSYLSQNIFVITFVATLQQLVEASARVELQRAGDATAGWPARPNGSSAADSAGA